MPCQGAGLGRLELGSWSTTKLEEEDSTPLCHTVVTMTGHKLRSEIHPSNPGSRSVLLSA
eukprot:363973-Chlamydomonas_euryale.AAC.11